MANGISPEGDRRPAPRWSLLTGLAALSGILLILVFVPRQSSSRGESIAPPPRSGPVHWWPGENNAMDMAGKNHGIVPLGGKFALGKVGFAFSFDALDTEKNREGETLNAIRIPGLGRNLPGSEITIEFWQNAERAQHQDGLLLSPYDYTHVCRCIAGHPDGFVYFDFGNNHTDGQLYYQPPVSIYGGWQHFALVASQAGNFMKIYRNGKLEAQKLGMTAFENTNYDLLIGNGFTGLIDEVKIYNRALSAAEVLSVYDAGSGKVASATSPSEAQVGQRDGDAGDNTASVPLPASKGRELP